MGKYFLFTVEMKIDDRALEKAGRSVVDVARWEIAAGEGGRTPQSS